MGGSERIEVLIAGFGGQGIVLLGLILGKAVSLYDGKNAIQTQSYGPEARGGACRSEVVISDGEIDYPMVTQPDILVAMSQEAFDRFHGALKDTGRLLIDSDLVECDPSSLRFKVYRVPSTRTAVEVLKRRVVANIVMLGALARITGIVSEEALRKSVEESVPEGTEELNLDALERGFEIASVSRSF